MKDKLLKLAERCEAADGRWYNHELDADIYEALGYDVIRERRHSRGVAWKHRGFGQFGFVSHWTSNLAFTYKLDDAVKLVPEGYAFSLFSDGCAGVAPIGHPDDLPTADCHGATPALALCAAALRAKASQ